MTVFGISLVIIVLLLLAAVGLGGIAVSVYNSLVQVRNNVDKSFSNIDVLLQQRHDELPKLVETCKTYMKYEKDILEKIILLREHYGNAKTVDEKTKIENDISTQLVTLTARMEAYPDLKTNQNFIQVQNRISALESGIADRREFFNDSVNIYNIQIERFPHMMLAKMLNYSRKAFLEVPQGKKEDVKLGFA
jgi:LemA protein